MDKERSLHAVMLSELPHAGERTAARVLAVNRARGHSLATFFRLPAAVWRDEYQLHPASIDRLSAQRAAYEQHCAWLLDRLAAAGGTARLADDPTYPARLRQRLQPPPAVLYGVGAAAVLAMPALAILNSRSLTEHTVTATTALVQAAAGQGWALATGGMKAGYRIAAVAGRAAAAPRLIVLDRGIFATFGAHVDRDPFGFGPGHGPLDTAHTLVLSPFRLLDHASPRSGRRRDALIGALADVVVAVHARPGGEIERVCLAALDRGQCVLSWYGENAGLVAAGATPIEEADLRGGLARFLQR